MDVMLEKLKEYGADIEGAMGRFLNDVDLYKTCFALFLEDEAFSNLQNALSVMDYENAFEYAHTLKGVVGNMGLTPLYLVICNMVDSLRKKEYSGLQHDWATVTDQVNVLKKMQE